MAKGKHYDWRNGPAELDEHSLTKHQVLVDYLVKYFEQRTCGSPGMDKFRLTLVDGFCGGGKYRVRGTDRFVLGSPLRMLEAVELARTSVNAERTKPLRLEVQFVFVDEDRFAIEHLRKVLIDEGYEAQLDKNIYLYHADFKVASKEIIKRVLEHTPEAGRALFFLDQYGYSDVPAPLIRTIFASLKNSEIVLTFHVSSFATYSTDELVERIGKTLEIDIVSELRGQTIEQIKSNDADWRRFIQGALYQALVTGCGAQYFTPFFIRGGGSGHGEYWLVHLSQHHRAQDVMKQVHWSHHNHFVHYGGAGLNMLAPQTMGFRQAFDGGFRFDDVARESSIIALTDQLADHITALRGSITLGKLFARTCNTSPGTAAMYHEVMERLSCEKFLTVEAADGRRRRRARYMRDTDIIERSAQIGLFTGLSRGNV